MRSSDVRPSGGGDDGVVGDEVGRRLEVAHGDGAGRPLVVTDDQRVAGPLLEAPSSGIIERAS